MKNIYTRLGAIAYLLWGLLHLFGGFSLYIALQKSVDTALGAFATNSASVALGEHAAVAALLGYYAWLMMALGLIIIMISWKLSWNGYAGGYWFNLELIGLIELGMVFFVLMPGVMRWSDGAIGLALYAIGALLSTIGRKMKTNS
jgi:hypothetical protein